MEQESDEALKKRWVDALAESDSLQGDERAERLVWLAQFSTCKPGQVIAGRIEPLSPMEEARVCYVNGNYIAVLLTATAFIDQAIVDELDERGIGAKPRTLREAVDVARQASVFPGDLCSTRLIDYDWSATRSNTESQTITSMALGHAFALGRCTRRPSSSRMRRKPSPQGTSSFGSRLSRHRPSRSHSRAQGAAIASPGMLTPPAGSRLGEVHIQRLHHAAAFSGGNSTTLGRRITVQVLGPRVQQRSPLEA